MAEQFKLKAIICFGMAIAMVPYSYIQDLSSASMAQVIELQFHQCPASFEAARNHSSSANRMLGDTLEAFASYRGYAYFVAYFA